MKLVKMKSTCFVNQLDPIFQNLMTSSKTGAKSSESFLIIVSHKIYHPFKYYQFCDLLYMP